VNAALPTGRRRWTQDWLVRAVQRLVAEGLADTLPCSPLRRAGSPRTGWSRSSPGSPAAPRTRPSARLALSWPGCASALRQRAALVPPSVAYLL
jgi:hypothetical protein